ncbi:MAG: hypothetical protein Q8P63_01780 [Candidatus Nealsonbacteria bacterium]|nr:hypothetical protein [Candidatus Nealsonbacteria bacterium]
MPPLSFSPQDIQKIKDEIPELPQQKRERFKKQFKLEDKDIEIFVQNRALGEYFEKVALEIGDPKIIKLCANYIITDLQGLLKGKRVSDKDFKIIPKNFVEFIGLINQGKISSKIAKVVLQKMFSTGQESSNIIKEFGLTQITDQGDIKKAVEEAIEKNPKAVEDYKKGKTNSFQFLIGQIMSQTKGRANPGIISQILKKLLTN